MSGKLPGQLRRASFVVALSALAVGAPMLTADLRSTPSSLESRASVAPVRSQTSGSELRRCRSIRKRLWTEGEGWSVRKVTLCG